MTYKIAMVLVVKQHEKKALLRLELMKKGKMNNPAPRGGVS